MYYKFKENVYLVNGVLNSCIYDLCKCKLYSINGDSKKFIEECILNDHNINNFKEEEYRLIQLLIQSEILESSTQKGRLPNILELKTEYEVDFAWIEITTKCNLKCIHCYDEASPTCDNEMEFEKFKNVIDILYRDKIKKIQLIGGEPFVLGTRLKDYIEYCDGKFESIEIFTNGTLLNEEWVKYLKVKKVKVALSLYSYDENEHFKVTLDKKSHKKTMETISLLEKLQVKFRVERVKIKGVSIGQPIIDKYNIIDNYDLVRLSGRGNINLYDKEMLKEKLRTESSFESLQIVKESIIKNVSGHNCFLNNIYIRTDLTVYPCVMERRMSHGNLKGKKSINEVMQNNIKIFNKDKITVCKECEYRYACSDCRPDNFSENDKDKPWNCTYNPYTGEWINEEIFINKLFENN